MEWKLGLHGGSKGVGNDLCGVVVEVHMPRHALAPPGHACPNTRLDNC